MARAAAARSDRSGSDYGGIHGGRNRAAAVARDLGNFSLKQIWRYAMVGWKTRAAGFASIAWGLWRVYNGDGEAVQHIIEGLAILGLGHKLDRIGGGA
jgi:hypothetical protein